MAIALFTPVARCDIIEIEDYIASRSEASADVFLNTLDEKCQILADNPSMGRRRWEFGANIRSFPFNNYLIFYRSAGDNIEILRVLHTSRDIDSIFGEEN